jgi:hypothetical protein
MTIKCEKEEEEEDYYYYSSSSPREMSGARMLSFHFFYAIIKPFLW